MLFFLNLGHQPWPHGIIHRIHRQPKDGRSLNMWSPPWRLGIPVGSEAVPFLEKQLDPENHKFFVDMNLPTLILYGLQVDLLLDFSELSDFFKIWSSFRGSQKTCGLKWGLKFDTLDLTCLGVYNSSQLLAVEPNVLIHVDPILGVSSGLAIKWWGDTRPGKRTKNHWKWLFIVDLPIKNGDLP